MAATPAAGTLGLRPPECAIEMVAEREARVKCRNSFGSQNYKLHVTNYELRMMVEGRRRR